MQLSALSLAITRLGRVPAYSPLALFTGTTTGAWYDPSDTTTLFRDAAGTQPVTAVEQPVGLMLDKSKGLVLGPELVTNGTFDSNINGWSVSPMYPNGTLSWVAGKLRITLSAAGWCFAYVNLTGLNTSSRFIVTTTTSSQTTQFAKVIASSGVGGYPGSLGYDSGNLAAPVSIRSASIFPASTGSILIGGYGIAGQYVEFDNISVRELPGNHAFNSSGNSANFPVLSARYNLLTKSEDFSDAAWSKFTAGGITITVTANAGVAPDGSTTADRVTSTGDASVLQNGGARVSGTVYTMSMWVKRAGSTNQTFRLGAGNGTSQDFSGNFTATNEWQRFSFNVTATGGGSGIYDGVTRDSSNNPYDILVWGADLRVANDALNQPAYQRVNTATDYDTVGFKPYLRFNGTNQWLQTNSIDFTYGDKMFVSAGVRKLVNSIGMFLESSSAYNSTNNGSFALYPEEVYGAPRWTAGSRGTLTSARLEPAPSAPRTEVISSFMNIGGSLIAVRLDGVAGTPYIDSQGTGNYGNYPLYLGARAGSSLWFNGRLYQMVVAGKQASAAEITSTETYINQKTGAF